MALEISFSEEKNQLLIATRGISFEEIIKAIHEGKILANKANPSKKYPHQKVLVVHAGSYIYAVPYVIKNKGIFLKTIYPSRVLKKKYLIGK